MKKYDLVVIGSGCGAIVSDEAVGHGQKVALVDKGPLGGTTGREPLSSTIFSPLTSCALSSSV